MNRNPDSFQLKTYSTPPRRVSVNNGYDHNHEIRIDYLAEENISLLTKATPGAGGPRYTSTPTHQQHRQQHEQQTSTTACKTNFAGINK
jgi:hypothetical protein